MLDQLISTTGAAKILNVTPSTIKRWADEGVLPCEKTHGGHRRFRLETLRKFGRTDEAFPELALDRWIELLTSDTPQEAVTAALMGERAERGAWWRVAEAMGAVLNEIGLRWAGGRLSVLAEHKASERLARALMWCSQALPVAPDASRCLLVSAVGDEHTLGLSLVELCLREAGWTAIVVGRNTPNQDVVGLIEAGAIEMVALSASVYSQDPAPLLSQYQLIEQAAEIRGVPVLLGGGGRWPEAPSHGRRVRSFEALRVFLGQLG